MMKTLRHNDIGIVCLGNQLHKKLFGYEPYELADLDMVRVRALEEFPEIPEVNLPEIPDLPYGNDIQEYFEAIAQRYFDKHRLDEKIKGLMSIDDYDMRRLRDRMPNLINNTRAGVWTKMDVNGKVTETGELDSDALVFDTETFVTGSDCNSAIVAQAIGLDYSGVPCLWMRLHPCFDEDIEYIPEKVSVGQHKLLIGHNFAFDRQKLAEAYTLKKPNNVYLCTMAMMRLVAGLDDGQRWATDADPRKNYRASKIQEYGCKMGLIPCYEYMTGKDLPKDAKKLRNIFVKAKEFQEFRDDRYDILEYSMLDVLYNLELFQLCYPRFMEMSSHKAIIAGQSIVIDAVVPSTIDWDAWVERCDIEYEKIERQVYDVVYPVFKSIHEEFLHSEGRPEQLEVLDWNYVLPFRHRKNKPLPEDWDLRAKWFEKFRKGDLSLKGRDLQVLMMCEYKYQDEWFDVIYTRKNAFHIVVEDEVVKLPNRKNPGANYGNILSADSLFLAENGELRSKNFPDKFLEILHLFDLTTTYTGFRKRVIAQNRKDGIVAAEVNPAGTISGRTVSGLYNTLPAHWHTPKIMSEIKMTSQCPEGWVFVGGDVDNQEATVAAAMGDSFYGASGACPFSAAVIVGTKDKGTDFHSINAKNVTGKAEVSGEERFGAKGLGFGLIYGAGVSTTAKTIALAYGLSSEEALSKARNAVSGFKGEREFWNDKVFGKQTKPFAPYEDGLASDVFNKMVEMIRDTPHPTGLFFGNQWPRCLQPYYCGTDGSPPQLNYCIQASCSTYGFLSAWVLAIYDEMDRNNLDARFGISIHDEGWWLSPEEQAEEVAYWQMISYARCWALLNHNLLIEDLPLSRAFPSALSIDKILRKSPTASTKTPSFDESPPGREVTIYDYAK